MIREALSIDVRVIELPGDRLEEAVGVLTRSFHANPNFVDLFPDEGARVLPHMQRAGLHDTLGIGHVMGHVYAATRRGGEILGVAELPLYILYAGAPPASNVLTRILMNLFLLAFIMVFLAGFRYLIRRADWRGGSAW